MEDRLGINREPLSVINVTPVRGEALDDLNRHLNKLEAEIGHILTAVRDMRMAISQKNTTLLAGGVRNSRNWTATAVVGHCYIQTLLGANLGEAYSHSQPMAKFYLYSLFERAAKLGVDDAIATRHRLNVRPISPIQKV